MEKFKKGSREDRIAKMMEMAIPQEDEETPEDEAMESPEHQMMEDKLGIEKHKSWVPGIMGNSYEATTEGDEGVRDMSNEDGPKRPSLFGKNGINIHLHLGAKK